MAGGPTLARRVRLLVGGVGVVLVVVLVGVASAVASFRDDVNRREDLVPAAGDATELAGTLVDQLQQHPAATAATLQEAFVLIGRLDREVTGHPELVDRLTLLRSDLLSWQASLGLGLGTDDEPTDPASVAAVQDRLFGALLDRSEALTTAITDASERASRVVEGSRTRLLWSIAGAAGAALLLLAVGATGLRRWFVVPVHGLVQDIGRVADGEHDHALRVDGSRELAQLAESVTRMRDRILAERDRAVRATEAADQQAPAVAALRTLLEPRLAEPPAGITVAGSLVPAEGALAGDWFDIGAREGVLVVALGDVCGHGVEAGVLAVRTKFALLDAMTLGLDPAAALDLAARRFARDDTFVTAMFVEVDPGRARCRYASAGHNPGLVVRTDGHIDHLPRTGPLIGLVDGPRPTAEVAIGPGDLIVLYTDGVVEARDAAGEQLLVEGLEAIVRERPDADPVRLVEAITGAVLAQGGGRSSDDATVVVVRVDHD